MVPMHPRLSWLILTIAALALRLPDVGNPLVDLDEQMYLLVGQRLWMGAIPYVDIWDRKPIGLFLIYAASHLIPGDPVVAYHLLALAAAIATAGLIAALARRFAPPGAALAGGLVYLVWLELIGGRGGQSPVFYDLLMAAAALLAWDSVTGRRRAAVPVMLLAGLALQIKPTAVFEGCFFGLALLAASWRRHRAPARLTAQAGVYVAVALLPTVVAFAVYAAIGHGDAWWFANVRSIFLRHVTTEDPIVDHLTGAATVLAVPAVLAIWGLSTGPQRLFFGGWLAAALIGWLLVPPYYNHYALPLLVPLSVAAAGALERRSMQIVAAVAGGCLLLLSGYPHAGETANTRRRLAALADIANQARGQGCLFVFQAPPALYTATGSCLPTRYPFASHLVQASEKDAIGVDRNAEVGRILAMLPPVIAIGPAPRDGDRAIDHRVRQLLASHYRPIARDLGITLYERAS